MTINYPEDSIQYLISGQWWTTHNDKELVKGTLIFAYIPYVDQTPYAFEPIGRTDPTQHHRADVKVTPLKVDQPLKKVSLPVAAMPQYDNECWGAYRMKRRPCVVVGYESKKIDKHLTRGMPKYSYAPTILVAPYYGIAQSLNRAGYNPEFVDRVRHVEYPHFFWDMLPHRNSEESFLRLDQIQPIGTHYSSYKHLGHRLCDEAVGVIDELIQYQIYGGVEEDALVISFKDLIGEYIS